MFRVESQRPRREHRPTAQNTPNTRKLQPRSDPTTWDKGRGKRQNRGGRYHKSPNDATVKLSTRKRELKQLFHTPLLAANYSNANISGVPYW